MVHCYTVEVAVQHFSSSVVCHELIEDEFDTNSRTAMARLDWLEMS